MNYDEYFLEAGENFSIVHGYTKEKHFRKLFTNIIAVFHILAFEMKLTPFSYVTKSYQKPWKLNFLT